MYISDSAYHRIRKVSARPDNREDGRTRTCNEAKYIYLNGSYTRCLLLTLFLLTLLILLFTFLISYSEAKHIYLFSSYTRYLIILALTIPDLLITIFISYSEFKYIYLNGSYTQCLLLLTLLIILLTLVLLFLLIILLTLLSYSEAKYRTSISLQLLKSLLNVFYFLV